MRRFVAFCDGHLRIESEAGGGTTVTARLGPERPPGGIPGFRVIDGG